VSGWEALPPNPGVQHDRPGPTTATWRRVTARCTFLMCDGSCVVGGLHGRRVCGCRTLRRSRCSPTPSSTLTRSHPGSHLPLNPSGGPPHRSATRTPGRGDHRRPVVGWPSSAPAFIGKLSWGPFFGQRCPNCIYVRRRQDSAARMAFLTRWTGSSTSPRAATLFQRPRRSSAGATEIRDNGCPLVPGRGRVPTRPGTHRNGMNSGDDCGPDCGDVTLAPRVGVPQGANGKVAMESCGRDLWRKKTVGWFRYESTTEALTTFANRRTVCRDIIELTRWATAALTERGATRHGRGGSPAFRRCRMKRHRGPRPTPLVDSAGDQRERDAITQLFGGQLAGRTTGEVQCSSGAMKCHHKRRRSNEGRETCYHTGLGRGRPRCGNGLVHVGKVAGLHVDTGGVFFFS